MSKIVQLTLADAVTHNEATYSDLTFRKALVGDLMAGEQFKGEISQSVAVLSSISEVPIPAFKKISAEDFSRILEATAGLLGNAKINTTGG
ncbi:phage tail assembly protein [Agrobacterium rhizogenes]|nr:phage tail assembly protein [Rhizobium rhizogenes]